MISRNPKQPLLHVRFEGSAIRDGRILLDDFFLFVSNLNLAIERTINVLLTGTSLRIGRPSRAFQIASALEVVAIGRGSFDLALDLRRDEQQQLPGFDIGIQAIDRLMAGLKVITPDSPLPEGFDQGVLMALREAGRVLDRGVDEIHLSTRRRIKYRKVTYAQTTRESIVSSIRRLEQAWVSVEGRLLMADVKEDSLRCRIHPSSGMPVLCTYDESLVPQIMVNLRRFVKARGEASRDPITSKIRALHVYDLESIEGVVQEAITILPPSAFWEAKDFDELATEQAVYPIDDLNKIFGGFPEDADFEAFLAAIRSARED